MFGECELKTSSKGRSSWVALGVALVTFAVFLPATQNGFVGWDDPTYIYDSPGLAKGGADFIGWAFSSIVASNWHPLTLISHRLDYLVFGLNPAGHHLTSILLHSINTFLVFRLVCLISSGTGEGRAALGANALIAALVTSLLFGLHPLRVESVAWVSERKDLLCAFFFLLSIISYLKYRERERCVFYIASLLAFALSLLSKPMAVSLPIVLILIDFYPLNLLLGTGRGRVLFEKLPFFALSIAISITAVVTQHSTGAVAKLTDTALSERALVASSSFFFYIYKTVLPVSLAPLYPYPEPSGGLLFSLAAFVAVTLFFLVLAKKTRLPFVLWAVFVVTLLPVSGIIQVGAQAAADRYTYLPGIAPFLGIALAVAAIYNRYPKRNVSLLILIAAVAVLSLLTLRQTALWRDTVTLWSHEIKLYPTEVSGAYYNRALAYMEGNETDKALSDLTKSIGLNPSFADSYNNRGVLFAMTKDYDRAEADFSAYIRLSSDEKGKGGAHRNLANIYLDRGLKERALEHFKKAAELGDSFSKDFISGAITPGQ